MVSLNEEANICFIEDREVNKIAYNFLYPNLFRICKKLNKETSKLKRPVSNFKETIFFIEIENENLLEEVETLIKNTK